MATTKVRPGTIPFIKMHGIGNDFVVFDAVTSVLPKHDVAALAREMCDRRFGVGADGTIYVEREAQDKFRMRMYNPDGSESEMCGNGIRCVAKFLRENGLAPAGRIPVETGAGLLTLEPTADGHIRVDMGKARLARGEIGMVGEGTFIDQPVTAGSLAFRGTAVSMGNPHLVLVVNDVAAIDLERLGPILEHHELFPSRVNVHFVQVVDRANIVQRTWERGAGITLACGTGACACAVAAFENGLTERSVDVKLPGGTLHIDYKEDRTVFMTGPAETVFEGEWELN